MPPSIRFLYSSKVPTSSTSLESILFFPRLREIFHSYGSDQRGLELFLTGAPPGDQSSDGSEEHIKIHSRRITHFDLVEALGLPAERGRTVCYVCGPPAMTDEFVECMQKAPGMSAHQVLCEKWW